MTGFEQEAIRNATAEDFGGLLIPVVTAEDLLLMKMLAARPRDTEDAAKILLRQRGSIDWDYVLRTARALEESIELDIVVPLERLRSGR